MRKHSRERDDSDLFFLNLFIGVDSIALICFLTIVRQLCDQSVE